MATVVTEARRSATSARWIQLVLGLIAMMSISSPQYVWTLFTKPLQDALGAK
jgi:OFA family oxalate/formate antiporter-like MFS transporter